MRVTPRTRDLLAARREARKLQAQGYRRHETDWEIHRGARYRDVIIDVQISVDGKYVWTLLGSKDERHMMTREVTHAS